MANNLFDDSKNKIPMILAEIDESSSSEECEAFYNKVVETFQANAMILNVYAHGMSDGSEVWINTSFESVEYTWLLSQGEGRRIIVATANTKKLNVQLDSFNSYIPKIKCGTDSFSGTYRVSLISFR